MKGTPPSRRGFLLMAGVVFLCCVKGTAQTNTSSNLSVTPVETETGVKGVPSRPKEDFQIKLHTIAAPTVAGGTNLPSKVDYGFHWDVSWEGWNGLHLGISQRTPFKNPREMWGLKALSNA